MNRIFTLITVATSILWTICATSQQINPIFHLAEKIHEGDLSSWNFNIDNQTSLNREVFDEKKAQAPFRNEYLAPKKYLFFDDSGSKSGMFSVFIASLGLIDLFETSKDKYDGLEINFQQSGPYYEPTWGDNWWGYYLNPIQVGNIEGPVQVVGKVTRRYLSYSTEFNYKETQLEMPREIGHSYIQRYFQVNPELQIEINAFVLEHFKGKYVISVHYRGTDKVKGSHLEATRVSYEEIQDRILLEKNDRKLEDFLIFAASDEDAFITFLQEAFPNQIISSKSERSTSGAPLHLNSSTPYKSGREAIFDCMLLSKGNLLIRTSSNLSFFVKYINPNIPIIEMSSRIDGSWANDLCVAHSSGPSICHDNLGIKRADMPQLENPITFQSYISRLEQSGINTRSGYVLAENLTPVQSELNLKKVQNMVDDGFNKIFNPCNIKPILISANNTNKKLYVVDGHHRYAACFLLGKPILAITVDRSVNDVLADLKIFPGVEFQGFNEFNSWSTSLESPPDQTA